jgi:hypothetical protein
VDGPGDNNEAKAAGLRGLRPFEAQGTPATGAGSVGSDGGVQGVGIAVGIGDYDLLRAGG